MMDLIFATALVVQVQGNNTVEERTTLRKMCEGDAVAFYAIVGDEEVMQHLSWERYATVEESSAFLKKMKKHPWFYAICVDGEVVGFVILTPQNDHTELSYALAKAHWGKGIATVAVKKVLKICKGLAVERIVAFVNRENVASQKVLLKSGMQCEGLLEKNVVIKGEMKDQYVYAMMCE